MRKPSVSADTFELEFRDVRAPADPVVSERRVDEKQVLIKRKSSLLPDGQILEDQHVIGKIALFNAICPIGSSPSNANVFIPIFF